MDLWALAGCDFVLAVSLAHRFLPRPPDAIYACDGRFWDHYVEEVRAAAPHAQLWTAHARAARDYGLRLVELDVDASGLCETPGRVHGGKNSGYQALNLAMHLGATLALLVGFDMRPAADGQQHAFGEHPGSLCVEMPFAAFVAAFATVPPVVGRMRIINCTPGSRLTMFPTATLDEVLCATG